MRELPLTIESLAEQMDIDPRTLYRWLQTDFTVRDSHVNAVAMGFTEFLGENESEQPLLDELLRIHSPELAQVMKTFMESLEANKRKSPR
jgi:hypothetical protein